jgi:hypothetical protein
LKNKKTNTQPAQQSVLPAEFESNELKPKVGYEHRYRISRFLEEGGDVSKNIELNNAKSSKEKKKEENISKKKKEEQNEQEDLIFYPQSTHHASD